VAGAYDQISIFSGNSNPALVDEICTYLSIPRGRAEVFKFSNDNTFVRIGSSVRHDDVFVIQSFSAPVNDAIMEMLIMIDTLKRASAGRVTAGIPLYRNGPPGKKEQPRGPNTGRPGGQPIVPARRARRFPVHLPPRENPGLFSIPGDRKKGQ